MPPPQWGFRSPRSGDFFEHIKKKPRRPVVGHGEVFVEGMPDRRQPLFFLADHVGPVGVEELATWLVGALVGVRSEEVALGLQQVGWKHGSAVAVVVTKRSAEGRNGDAVEGGEGYHFAPVLLELVEELGEEGREHQVAELRIAAIGIGDVVEETSTDDAATAPDGSDFSEVETPVFLGTHGFDEVEALGVGNDFRGEQGIVYFFDECSFFSGDAGGGALQFGTGGDAFVFHRGKDAGFDSGVDGRDHDGVFDGVEDGPFAGAFLACGIEDQVNEGLASLGIVLFENLGGDLDQVALEVAVVPIGENLSQFCWGEAGVFEDVVGFANQLHVAILDAVVDHFDVVASTTGADVCHARFAFGRGSDRFKNRLHDLPGGSGTAGHDGRSFAGTFFATRNAGTDETQAFFGEVSVATLGSFVVGIATIDDDVALIEKWDELFNHGINGIAIGIGDGAGFHHDLDLARGGERLHEIFERVGTDEFFVGMSRDEFIGRGGGAVENADLKAARFYIENEILAHDGQSDKSEVAFAHNWKISWWKDAAIGEIGAMRNP